MPQITFPDCPADARETIADQQVYLMTGGQPDATKCMVLLADLWRSAADMCPNRKTWHVEVHDYRTGFETGGVFSPALTMSSCCDEHVEQVRSAPGFISAEPIEG